jgi:hypothetical protein
MIYWIKYSLFIISSLFIILVLLYNAKENIYEIIISYILSFSIFQPEIKNICAYSKQKVLGNALGILLSSFIAFIISKILSILYGQLKINFMLLIWLFSISFLYLIVYLLSIFLINPIRKGNIFCDNFTIAFISIIMGIARCFFVFAIVKIILIKYKINGSNIFGSYIFLMISISMFVFIAYYVKNIEKINKFFRKNIF